MFLFFSSTYCGASPLASFDFSNNDVTQGFDNWHYHDIGENPCNVYAGATLSKLCADPGSDGDRQAIYYYYNGYNSDHMGWMRWGYIDSGDVAIKGRSLKLVFTGGAYDNNGAPAYSGLEVKSKSQWSDYERQGLSPYADRILPGDLTLYFQPTHTNDHFRSFPQLIGNDRLSVWVLPSEDSPFTLDRQKSSGSYLRPESLFSWYPFILDSNGDHYYHDLSNINMGGWIHYIFDAHPNHNNGGDRNPYSYYRAGGYDFPGNGVGYFNNVNKFSFRGGMAKNLPSPATIHIDEIESYKSSQPENDETIAGVGVGFDPSDKMFDISFNDKYRCASCNAVYEVRYSFDPVTNANYRSAKLAKVINFDRNKNNDMGIINKPSPGYSQIWAALELADADKAGLADGKTVYFGLKDVSDRSNLPDRDAYDLATVDVPGVGQVRRVDLVKTIAYTIHPLFRKLYFEDMPLRGGHVAQAYSEQIAVKGGVKPYLYELEAGSLPAGLTLSTNGLVSGTPTAVGTYNFKVRVRESSSFNQQTSKDFSLTIHNPEICADLIDNDADALTDCADPDCFSASSCSIALVDFAQPHVFGLPGWGALLKDAYTNYVAAGPGGMAVTVGSSGQYNYQGVRGAARNFAPGEVMLAYWYNNSNAPIVFTPRISFDDGDRPGSGAAGTWHPMSTVSVPPLRTAMSQFSLSAGVAGSHSLVNVNSNYDNSQTLICDKIILVPSAAAGAKAPFPPKGLQVR